MSIRISSASMPSNETDSLDERNGRKLRMVLVHDPAMSCPCHFQLRLEHGRDPCCPMSPSLAMNRYLHRTIQEGNAGHSSAEDAVAALELAQLKISKGPNFGAERMSDNIFDRLGR